MKKATDNRYRLQRSRCALLVVDVQERLCKAMDPVALERMLQRTCAAILGAKALQLPVVVTEQYPQGLGPTHTRVRALTGEIAAIPKTQFSCVLPEVGEEIRGATQILLVGMETHICVFQTARDLVERNLTPFICADAVISRMPEDREVGLRLARDAGAVITTVESALFDLLGRAGSPEFKLISSAVK